MPEGRRLTLGFRDRLIRDTPGCRIEVAHLIRSLRPRPVFASEGCGVHPDHEAVTGIVTNAVFYARLPRWDRVPGGERLAETEPHEIERLFFGHRRMEAPWTRFDFAVDVTRACDRELRAIAVYESVFAGDPATLVERYGTEDRDVGSLLGVRFAEPFKARSPLLVEDRTVFAAVPYG